jgi:hypothetical protein
MRERDRAWDVGEWGLHELRASDGRLWLSRQMIPGSNVSRTLARTGVDWVVVDCKSRAVAVTLRLTN